MRPLTADDIPAFGTSRNVHLTAASAIRPRPVRWLWDGRLALGTLALLGGREGIGKSIVSYTLAADITRGRMPGVWAGTAKPVIVAAIEDSWEYTIVPRLMAADADLDLVYRVDVETAEGVESALSLPRDLGAVEDVITEVGAVALILDPLMSRISAELDSHKDQEVRQALEPLVCVASRTGCCVLGLLHVSKGTSSDPLTLLMGSRAFAAVARAVLFVMTDPNDDTTRLLGEPKNNLGRSDLPTLSFRIVGHKAATTIEGDIWTGKLQWTGETEVSIRDALQQAVETGTGNRTATSEAADWLQDYLNQQGGSADSADIKKEGAKVGHSKDALHRARTKLQITSISVGFPRRTHWALQSSQASGESSTTTTTATTGAQPSQPSQSSQSFESPQDDATTCTDCCEGGPTTLRCRLCAKSATYWQRVNGAAR